MLSNIIVFFKEKKIIFRYRYLKKEGKYEIATFNDFDGYMTFKCEKNMLLEFLIVLFISLKSISLHFMDIEKLFRDK